MELAALDRWPGETPVELDADSREELGRLLGFLEISRSYDLYLLRYDSEAVLDYVATALRGRHGERVVSCALPEGRGDLDPVVELMRTVQDARVERPIFLLRGLDAVLGLFGERRLTLHLLNERRDLLTLHMTGPLIMALRPLQLQQLRDQAPDFFSIHTAVCRVRSVARETALRPDVSEPWREDVEALQRQIARLSVVPSDESARLRARLLGRRARALAAAGDAVGADADFARALDAARASGDAAIECDLLVARGGVRLSRDDVAGAEQDCADAGRLAQGSGRPEVEARLHRLRAGLLFARGQLDEALVRAAAAEAAFAALARPRASGAAAVLQGEILHAMGRGSEAAERYDTAVATLRAAGGAAELAWAHLGLANLARQRGDAERGLALYDEALRLFRDAAFVPGVASALAGKAMLTSLAGNRSSALAQLAEARALFRDVGARRQEARLWLTDATWLRSADRLAEAERSLQQARELSKQIRDAHLEGQVLQELGRIQLLAAANSDALDTLAHALRQLESAGAVSEAASCLCDRAHALLALGRANEAAQEARAAVALAATTGDPGREGWARATLGDVLAADQPSAALEAWRSARALFERGDAPDAAELLRERIDEHRARHPDLAQPSP